MKKRILVFIISSDNIEYIKNAILEVDNIENADLLIIDEGSNYNLVDEIAEYKSVISISFDNPLGYGACLDSARQYAMDFNYDYLISLDCNSPKTFKDLPNIVSNLEYGYDVVNCSRILENYDYSSIDSSILDFFEELSENLNSIIDVPLTDPLSINVGLNIKTTDQLELTDCGHGIMLQLFIQSQFFGYNIIEIPSEAEIAFGNELQLYEDPISVFFTIIETEKYLYNKGTVN